MGTVHQILGDPPEQWIDVYIGTGPDFLSVPASDLAGGLPVVDDPVEFLIEGLSMQPSRSAA